MSVDALAALPLLLPTHPNSVRVAMERLFNERHLRFQLVAETSAVEILILAVERGLGATILPTSAFALAQQHGRVRSVPLVDRPLLRELSLRLLRSSLAPPVVVGVLFLSSSSPASLSSPTRRLLPLKPRFYLTTNSYLAKIHPS